MGNAQPVEAAETSETRSGRPLHDRDDPSARLSPPPPPRRPKDRVRRRMTKAFVALVLGGGFGFGLLFLVMPSAGTATALVRAQAGSHGIAYPDSPPPLRFAKALVATEDHRFYSPFDPGIDAFAIARATLEQITGHRGDPGGSTITQQLAKMLYTPRRGLTAKLEQVALAIKLNFAYSKIQILSMYAEVAYFGSGYYGLAAAGCGYFGKAPANLTWAQAAILAGAVNAPTADDPRTHPADARMREAHVLDRLVAVGYLTRAQAKAALSQ